MDTYEKAYKEALERARVWKEKSGMPKDKQGILDDIFPELAESKDERIRKALIRFHKSSIDVDGIKGEDIIAWLEKQGKERKITHEEICKSYVIAEMQKDWSKEDEERIKNIISVLDWDGTTGKKGNPYQNEIDWLYSLKNRVLPKQEWSEEDDITRKALINLVEMFYGYCIDKSEKNRLLDWLKSIKERRTWKPSDEQMDTLLSEVTAWTKGCPKQKVLESLYNDLKKLMEK